jgi:hypothetical protein
MINALVKSKKDIMKPAAYLANPIFAGQADMLGMFNGKGPQAPGIDPNLKNLKQNKQEKALI